MPKGKKSKVDRKKEHRRNKYPMQYNQKKPEFGEDILS